MADRASPTTPSVAHRRIPTTLVLATGRTESVDGIAAPKLVRLPVPIGTAAAMGGQSGAPQTAASRADHLLCEAIRQLLGIASREQVAKYVAARTVHLLADGEDIVADALYRAVESVAVARAGVAVDETPTTSTPPSRQEGLMR